MGEPLPTPREAMSYAVQSLLSGDHEVAQAWVAVARELREGTTRRPENVVMSVTPGQLDFGQRYEDVPGPAAESDAETIYGYTRGQQRPPSVTAYRAAVKLRKAIDRNEPDPLAGILHVDPKTASEIVDEILSRRPEGLDELSPGDELRSYEDFPQRWVAGGADPAETAFNDPETLRIIADKLRREPSTERFDAFAAGRASVDAAQLKVEQTGVLDAGDPSRCRYCDLPIIEVTPSEHGTGHPYRHTYNGMAMCPSPSRGMSEQGDESYVTGAHNMAAPGGMPYRAE